MIAKLIPTRVHGVLDYLTGLTLIAIPLLFNWPQPEATIFMALGGGTLVYSLLTRYEPGVFKLLPMPAHLLLDLLSGLFLVAAPFLGLVDENLRIWFWAFGLFEIGAALLSDTRPHFDRDQLSDYYTSTAMTGRNTSIAEGDRPNYTGAAGTTYTGSTATSTAGHQTLPDDASWTSANRSASLGAMGETAATREDGDRIEHNRETINR
jgi:hypothetical protein